MLTVKVLSWSIRVGLWVGFWLIFTLQRGPDTNLHLQSHPGDRPQQARIHTMSNDQQFSSGTDDPLSDAEIQAYRLEINELDRTIIEAAARRSEVSQIIGKTRKASGGTKLVYSRETAILNEYRDALGPEGVAIANALLQLGRGRLGQ